MTPSQEQDQSYADASPRALGRSFGAMLVGMVDAGMSRVEALEILKLYVWALASRPEPDEAEP